MEAIQIELANKTWPLYRFEDLPYKNTRTENVLVYKNAITGSTPSVTYELF